MRELLGILLLATFLFILKLQVMIFAAKIRKSNPDSYRDSFSKSNQNHSKHDCKR